MTDKTVASLTAANALTGTELLYGDDGTNDVKVTAAQVKTFVSASPALVTPALGTPASGTLTNTTGYPTSALAGLGTGIATTLAVNVGTAGAPVVNGGALGTPASGTATNLSGTASALTAGNVTTNANLTGDVTSVGNATTLTNAPVIAKVLTGYASGAGTVSATDSILSAIQKLNGNDATNANLTGVITSVGNATSIASQTGTGTKFVVDTSPTLVTPALGVATGTSLAIGGATIGTNGLAVTGTGAFSGAITFGTGTITGLTNKASPVGADDYVIIYDAAGTAVKKATVSSVGSAGAVSSVNGNTGAIVLVPLNCGRLSYVGATAIKFVPYNGNLIKINGAAFLIPTGGIAGVANTSVFVNGVGASNLGASTLYYVYAFSNGGTVTADFSTTAHATSSTAGNEGVEIKSADDTRTLIGMVRTNGSSQFADSVTQRFVRSYFNRIGTGLSATSTTSRTTTSTSLVEISTDFRAEFLIWSDEVACAKAIGTYFSSASVGMVSALGFNGTTQEPGISESAEGNIGFEYSFSLVSDKTGLTEGYNYVTLLGRTNGASTVTWEYNAGIAQSVVCARIGV